MKRLTPRLIPLLLHALPVPARTGSTGVELAEVIAPALTAGPLLLRVMLLRSAERVMEGGEIEGLLRRRPRGERLLLGSLERRGPGRGRQLPELRRAESADLSQLELTSAALVGRSAHRGRGGASLRREAVLRGGPGDELG